MSELLDNTRDGVDEQLDQLRAERDKALKLAKERLRQSEKLRSRVRQLTYDSRREQATLEDLLRELMKGVHPHVSPDLLARIEEALR